MFPTQPNQPQQPEQPPMPQIPQVPVSPQPQPQMMQPGQAPQPQVPGGMQQPGYPTQPPKKNTGLIIGIVVGAVVLIGIIVAIILVLTLGKGSSSNNTANNSSNSSNSSNTDTTNSTSNSTNSTNSTSNSTSNSTNSTSNSSSSTGTVYTSAACGLTMTFPDSTKPIEKTTSSATTISYTRESDSSYSSYIIYCGDFSSYGASKLDAMIKTLGGSDAKSTTFLGNAAYEGSSTYGTQTLAFYKGTKVYYFSVSDEAGYNAFKASLKVN